ncbi:Oidioi.mRNA.OKI2018_I69.chr1.g1207.t1.cds [Oikopleura dioica]|uniref:Oidioi.mRNA.OKI2018_I69.chr1.g1207.t1.cds n=1 Tax=Oikopleura dioica TaxID=34765 RepID=A0ABN7SRG2_OIKDI|nr:Oidioi.mRNA.OKI2018_I69.chr1.g1207.t1.cds [Oikopleura dioica]
MGVLIPMAGTMTSFGGMKDAVRTPFNCTALSEDQFQISSDGSYDLLDETIECLKFEKIEATNSTSEGVRCCQELPYNFRGYEVNDTLLSLVGSLVFGFTVGSSVVTSPIIAKLGFRKTGLIGVVFAIIALLLTTWSTSFYFWIFTYSISFGVANNLLYNTGMQMCNKLFPTDFNTAATVIASFGVSLGTTIMSPMTIALTDAYGWRIRNYACCAILLFVAFPAVLLWSQPLEGEELEKAVGNKKSEDEEKDQMVEKADKREMIHPADKMNLFSSIVFWAWLWGTTAWSLDFVIPLDFAVPFMTENGISRATAGAVMSSLGISELIARVICALTGEQKKISKAMIYILFSLLGAAACALPIMGKSQMVEGEPLSVSLMYTYAIIVGFCAGVLNCLIMACTVDIFGQKRTVEVWGYVNLMLGVGFVGGPPIGAWFTTSVAPDLVYVFYLAIAFFLACAIIMAPIPLKLPSMQPYYADEAELKENNNNNNYNSNNNREESALLRKIKKFEFREKRFKSAEHIFGKNEKNKNCF